jgi:thermosome
MSERLPKQYPMIILGDDAQRTQGRDAQSMNIKAGRAVADSVRATLGPKGMDKMLVDSSGDVVITNDGVTILNEMDIGHPAANMIREVAETQEEEIGDGTTTAVIIAGELLGQAEGLIEQDIHGTIITQGFRQAAEKAKQVLEDNAIDVSTDDREILVKIATTAITGKGAENAKDLLAELVVNAVIAVQDEDGIDIDNVAVEKVVGGSIADSELIEGVLIDKKRVDENMPRMISDATVAIIGGALEVRQTEIDAEINVTDPDQLQQFLDREERELKELVDKLVDNDVDVVFVGGGIDDMAQHYLAKAGIIAVRRVKKSDLKRIARCTGGKVAGSVDDIDEGDFGFAGSVTQKNIGGDERLFIEEVEDAKSVTLVLRGGTEHVVDEIERAVKDSIYAVRITLQDGKVLPGGGAAEIAMSMALRDFADSISGREQLAVEAFADALEVVPRTLAETAGFDPIDTLVELRSQHSQGIDTKRRSTPPLSPTDIEAKSEYFETIYLLAEVGGLHPDKIRKRVDAAARKSPGEIRDELGSVYFHLEHGRFDGEFEQTLREISNIKLSLADYCATLTDSDNPVEQLEKSLNEEEFNSRVEKYVRRVLEIDKDLGYKVDELSEWFYRRKQEAYLQHRYKLEFDQDLMHSIDVSNPNREYHELFEDTTEFDIDTKTRHTSGLDVHSGDVADMILQGVVEPLRSKTRAIESATDAAVMILRIDDVIAAGDLKGGSGDDGDDSPPPGGGMGSMGGMGGAM